MSDLKNKKIIITGGLGLMGSSLVENLAKDGAKIIILNELTTIITNNFSEFFRQRDANQHFFFCKWMLKL